ncbi:MAG: OmpA family protein, partial [Deltaproteobacteria bacterium]|nr:OmpA family protein [Deltaproteobacteria bacterium]
ATGAATGRQSVIDNLLIGDFYGALGFTDWFEAGINIPVVGYNWFFTDNAAAAEDHGSGMGDMEVMMKFRLVNTENSRVGFSVRPFVTLPTGDLVRYMGNGNVTGGLSLITDFIFHERFTLGINLGGIMRDDVTIHDVRIDDQFVYGMAANFKASPNFHLIAEGFGKTNIRDFYGNTASTPLEAGGGIRYLFGDSGFVVSAGGTAGIIDGVGSPRFRGFAGLQWVSPVSQECPECPPPAPPPDPRIHGDKIVIWGKIFYDTDKTTIKPISFPVLDDVVDVMQKNPQLTLVEVQGHCDIRGGDAYNMRLSQGRAESARNYLISKGVDATRLTAKGYGWHKPIADNNTREGMSQNRRTEFVILQRM